ncbi:hypothetical protein CPC08DRAFT_752317 [Agrocybe pediades]|nr:hypothetical protein CPC08DRAFT_752317 [Agrocybe pediades]
MFLEQHQLCDVQDIKRTALHLAEKVTLRPDIVEDVAAQIHITAITQLECTRSLVLLIQIILDELSFYRDRALSEAFSKEIVDLATSTYVYFWTARQHASNKARREMDIDPGAISSFVGDLASLGLISFERLDRIILHFLGAMSSRDDIFAEFFDAHAPQIFFRSQQSGLLRSMIRQIRQIDVRPPVHSWKPRQADGGSKLQHALMSSVCIDPVKVLHITEAANSIPAF